MQGFGRGWTLVGLLVAFAGGCLGHEALGQTGTGILAPATPVLTTLTDTVYRANGTPAGGSVLVSWPAFTAANGANIPQGSVAVPVVKGVLTVGLVANVGSTPVGSYYTAVYHLDDGTVSKEYWVIPTAPVAGSAPVRLAQVRSQVLPVSVAMQTVSKAYVDTAIAAAVTGTPVATSLYVLKAGDTMSGPLVLPADPVSANQAADKHYVDASVAAGSGGVTSVVSTVPSVTQTVTQPSGTQLAVNLLNGTVYTQAYATGSGGNGISQALGSADCATGCDLHVERTYGAENYGISGASDKTRVEDVRNGAAVESFKNPQTGGGFEVGRTINVVSTASPQTVLAQTGSAGQVYGGLEINHSGLTGGSNQYPQNAESQVPYFKTTYSALGVKGTYNTPGQHVLTPLEVDCFGVGDCLIGSQTILSSGGQRDDADEGAHPYDLQVLEDPRVFAGACQTGCTAGSTTVTVQVTAGGHTQGEGRFLIDMNQGKTIRGDGSGAGAGGGTLVSGGGGLPHPTANFSGTAFPLSTFFQTTAALTSQANNIAPGSLVVQIQTTGVPGGYQTNTAAAPTASGVACVVDQVPGNIGPNDYEIAQYKVVDGSHLQLINLGKAHAAAATIAIGGLCGYGLEQTVDTAGGVRQLFPVVGSLSATSVYYAASSSTILAGTGSTSGYVSLSRPIAALSRTNGVVTVTTAGALGLDVNGLTLTVSGAADQSYNGRYAVTTTGSNTLTYTQAGANSTTTGGTIGIVTGGFALYPMAEVLGVFDVAAGDVDGRLTLGPNTVPFAAGDALEEPHFYQELIGADTTFVSQVTPRPVTRSGAGVYYESNAGPGLYGWAVTNGAPLTGYLGNGGTHSVPDAAYEANGPWRFTMLAQAGDEAVFQIGCNSHGCGRWNSGYNLFELQSAAGQDTMGWQPQTSALNLNLRGTQFSFTPQGFTAGTVTAGTGNFTTLNAGLVTGAVAGGQITGSIPAGVLPVFGASGAGHAAGAVPDPGQTAGTTRFLREDGAFAVPAGGSGGSGATGAAAITSGTINGTTIGQSVAAAGLFTSLGVGASGRTQGDLFTVTTSNTTPDPYGFSLVNGGSGGVGFRMCNSFQPGCGNASTGQYWQAFVANDGTFKIGRAFIGDFLVMNQTTGASRFAGGISASTGAFDNGYTGNKTAGACTFVIVGGIITNVTGC